MAHYKPCDIARSSSQRHSYADLMAALADPVRDHSIESYARKRQRQQPKYTDQAAGHSLLPQSVGNVFLHSLYVKEREISVQRPHFVPNRLDHPGGWDVIHGTRHQGCPAVVVLKDRIV